jgi:membrane dipeptidase
MLIVDAHEDLAYNMRSFGRDYTLSALETRRREQGSHTVTVNEDTLLGYPEYRRGRVAVVFSTLFAAPQKAGLGDWETECYTTPKQAYQLYSAQLDTYRRLAEEHPDKFRLILARPDLEAVLAIWENLPLEPEQKSQDYSEDADHPQSNLPHSGNSFSQEAPVGLVMLMEGAEGIRSVQELEEWWQRGLRIIGLAWSGNRYTGSTREPGPLTAAGFALLEGMADLGFGLDLSHMDEKAALQALDTYPGTILASHANAKALLKGIEGNRHLSDRVIHGLIDRDGVIGIVPFNKFLDPFWTIKDGKDRITLQYVVSQIDYICQRAGDARHVGLGTDFDGGLGWQSVPAEIDTIADLQILALRLADKGYTQADVAAILGANWLTLLRRVLPEAL